MIIKTSYGDLIVEVFEDTIDIDTRLIDGSDIGYIIGPIEGESGLDIMGKLNSVNLEDGWDLLVRDAINIH